MEHGDRIRSYTVISFLKTILFIGLYFAATHGFRSDSLPIKEGYGIGGFDTVLLLIITIRGLGVLLFHLFLEAPSISSIWETIKEFALSSDTLGFFSMSGVLQILDNWTPKQWISVISLGLLSWFLWCSTLVDTKKFESLMAFSGSTEVPIPAGCDSRMSIHDYAYNWLDKRRSDTANIYLIAGQGGGSRAGFWTSSFLANIDDSTYRLGSKSFYNNLFAMSTVSGSSVGANVYVTAKKNKLAHNDDSAIAVTDLRSFFENDYFSSSLLRLFFTHPLQRFLPFYFSSGFQNKNRNDQLIHEENTSFNSIFSPKNRNGYNRPFEIITTSHSEHIGRHPLMLFNTYNVTNSEKSVISPVELVNSAHEEFLDSLKCESWITQGQAVNLSQMFPVMSGSAVVNGCQYYDGGIYDNSGLSTLREVYDVLSGARDLKAPHKRIVVIYLQNSQRDTGEIHSSNVTSLLNAVTGTMFNANPEKHVRKIQKKTSQNGDQFYCDIINTEDILLNRWLSPKNADDMGSLMKTKVSIFIDSAFNKIGRNLHPATLQSSVYFEFGDSTVREEEMAKICEVLNGIKPDGVVLRAYTDIIGTKERNMELAGKRAKNVKAVIRKCLNIEASDSSIIFHLEPEGERGNMDDFNRQTNRRVDISFKFYKPIKRYIAGPRY